MTFELIREIINKYYDSHDSKYLFGGAKRGLIEYYYNSTQWEWYTDYARRIGDEIFVPEAPHGHFDYVFYPDAVSSNIKTKCNLMLQCVLVGNCYSIEFYAIRGLRLRSFRSKSALQLILFDKSVFNIQIAESGELYWRNRRGDLRPLKLNWWLNRLLRENDLFRSLFIDLLCEISTQENKLILKDVAKTIEKNKYFLPTINIDDIGICHNPDQLIRFLTGRDTPVNFNKWDINCAYYIMRLSEQIEERDLNTLLQIPQEKLLSWIGNSDLFNGPQLKYFAANYYADKLEGDEERIRMLATDYANMCIANNERLTLRKRSIRSLEEIHDRQVARTMSTAQAAEFAKPLIAEESRFRRLRELLPDDFIWIDSTKALFEEGESQHNCVYTYRDKLRRDVTTIYHWDNEGRNYTIEFAKNGDKYSVSQMLQKYNRPALSSDVEIVKNYIRPHQEELHLF